MALSDRENFLRNASMAGPEWMPTYVVISGASWNQYGAEIDEVLLRHPALFPNHQPGQFTAHRTNDYGVVESEQEYVDEWGCRWRGAIDGIIGVVVENPLADWDKLDSYRMPDPLTQYDWAARARDLQTQRANGALTTGGLGHGFLFMLLYYLRGLEEVMVDYASDEPRLHTLIGRLTTYNETIVQQYLQSGVDVIDGGDDLGTQTASLISPAMFRQWITPAYKRIFQPARAAGCHVSLHSDGHMIELIDEIIDAGVTICNPQDLCNGIDEIKAAVDGRICIRLDVDRQSVVPFGTPSDIHDLVEEGVRKLGSPRGGLELIVGVYPPTPPENIEALCSAFEEYRTYWFDGRGK